MGPPRAAEIIREAIFRGADTGIVLTDRAFAGADTLATSYALSAAIRKVGEFDLIIAGVRLLTAIQHRWHLRWRKNCTCHRLLMLKR